MIKQLLQGFVSKKLSTAMLAWTPLIAQYTGVAPTDDFWIQLAAIVVGGIVSLGYIITQGFGPDKAKVVAESQLKALAIQAKAQNDSNKNNAKAELAKAFAKAQSQPERDRLSVALEGVI